MTDEAKHAELRLGYQDALDNLRYAKRQQWQLTYYGVILQAGIIGLSGFKAATNKVVVDGFVLGGLSIAVNAGVLWIMYNLQSFIQRERWIVRKIRDEYFSSEFRKTRTFKVGHQNILYDVDFQILFLGSNLIASTIAIRTAAGNLEFTIMSLAFFIIIWPVVIDHFETQNTKFRFYGD